VKILLLVCVLFLNSVNSSENRNYCVSIVFDNTSMEYISKNNSNEKFHYLKCTIFNDVNDIETIVKKCDSHHSLSSIIAPIDIRFNHKYNSSKNIQYRIFFQDEHNNIIAESVQLLTNLIILKKDKEKFFFENFDYLM
jgi:hypothetical protein